MSAEEAEGALFSHHVEALEKSRFLEDLYGFMESRDLSIEKIPQLGFKDLDLFLLYKTVQRFGGFDLVTEQEKWKSVYTILESDNRSTSAATSTRQHYEKLLLSYERHLTRYRNTTMTPTSLKRRRDSSSTVQDEGALRDNKRSAIYRLPGTHPPLLPNLTPSQRSPSISTDCKVRISRKTTDYQTHGDPSSYHSLFPNILTPQTNSQSHVYPHPHLHPLQSHCHHELCSLAQPAVIDLSKQSYSSLGWEEPLNLSFRGDGYERTGQRLLSFTPPSDKKLPKFLNRVSHMYQAWHLGKEKPGNLPTSGTEQTQPEFEPVSILEEDVIDLTASSNTSPVTSSPTSTRTYLNHSPLLSSTLGHLDITANNSLEQKFSPQTGELEGPPKLNCPLSDSFATSPGHMQTGFLQTLQQARIKDRFPGQAVAMEAAVTSSGQHGIAEPCPTKHGESGVPTPGSGLEESFGEPVCLNSTQKGEESHLHPINMGSQCERWKERELPPGRCGKACWSQPQVNNSEVMRPFPVSWQEAQELHAGRRCAVSQLMPITHCPPGRVATRKQDVSQHSLRPGVGPELLEDIPVTGPSEVLKDDLLQSLLKRLTPEEYWKLKQLITHSP